MQSSPFEKLIIQQRTQIVGKVSTLIGPVIYPKEHNQAFETILAATQDYAQQGCDGVVLGLDDDSLLICMLSPRTQTDPQALSKICELVKDMKRCIGRVGLALTVEENCPGGLDATDGIEIAKQLVNAGVDFIGASGGTADFPALKWRRKTKEKRASTTEVCLDTEEPWLASAAWLVPAVSVPVYAVGIPDNLPRAQILAERLGLEGLWLI